MPTPSKRSPASRTSAFAKGHSEAKILLDQNLKAIRAQLGPTHPETLRMMKNPVGVYRLQERDETAKDEFENKSAETNARNLNGFIP